METSDDPTGGVLTTIVVGALVGEGVKAISGQTSIFGKKDSGDRPARAAISPDADMKTGTAAPVETLSEEAKKKRRLAASALTRGFGEPTLGIPALTGT